jgi:hypothetical protein
LEIEHEKIENEQRAKDEKILVLENKAGKLNEKLLILKMEYEEKSKSGQENEGRLKEQLKEISDEMVALKKKRNEILLQDLNVNTNTKSDFLQQPTKTSSKTDNRASIRVMGIELPSDINQSKNSITEVSSNCSQKKGHESSNSMTFDKTIESYNQKMYTKFKEKSEYL